MSAVNVTAMREWREKHGITQRDVARVADVTERTVSRWEQGAGEPTLAHVAVLEVEWAGLLAAIMPATVRRMRERVKR